MVDGDSLSHGLFNFRIVRIKHPHKMLKRSLNLATYMFHRKEPRHHFCMICKHKRWTEHKYVNKIHYILIMYVTIHA